LVYSEVSPEKGIGILEGSTFLEEPMFRGHGLLFNIKITDLSDMENPFVIYEKKEIDSEGYIIFDGFEQYLSGQAQQRILPWLSNPREQLDKRTLKIEVTYRQELVLLRFIHLDKFYPLKFPQIMLEIANNIT
jgi:hypothetical protein